MRRKLARWTQEAYRISERHAARLVGLAIGTLRYRSRKVFDEVLRHRLRGTGRDPCALRLSTADGAVAAGRLARECQADLPAVHGGRTHRAHQAAAEDGPPTACGNTDGGQGGPLLEHGFRE